MGLSLDQRIGRVLKAAHAAGVILSRFTVSPNGEIQVFTGNNPSGTAAKDAAVVFSDRVAAMRVKTGG